MERDYSQPVQYAQSAKSFGIKRNTGKQIKFQQVWVRKLRLPEEIWIKIFSYIIDIDDIVIVSQVCQTFYQRIHAATRIEFPNLEKKPRSGCKFVSRDFRDSLWYLRPCVWSVSSAFLIEFPRLVKCDENILITDPKHIHQLLHLQKACFVTEDNDRSVELWMHYWQTHTGLLTKDHMFACYMSDYPDYDENDKPIPIKITSCNFHIVQGTITSGGNRHKLSSAIQKWQEANLITLEVQTDHLQHYEFTDSAFPEFITHIKLRNYTHYLPELKSAHVALLELLHYAHLIQNSALHTISLMRLVDTQTYFIDDKFHQKLVEKKQYILENKFVCSRKIALLIPLDLVAIDLLLEIFPNLSETILAPGTTVPKIDKYVGIRFHSCANPINK